MNTEETKLRIGVFFSNFRGGGIQRVMLTLAKGFLEKNHAVDIIVVDGEGPLRQDVPQDCRLINFDTGKVGKSFFPLRSYLITEKPDVLLAAQTHFNFVAIMARLLSIWDGKLVLSEHITIENMTNNWKEKLFPIIAQISYRLADLVILVSEGAARHFVERTHLPKAMIRTIYNPFDIHRIQALAKVVPQHQWFKNPDHPVFVSAGRMTQQKDFPTLLKAFQLVHAQLPKAKLVILGEGDDQSCLEKMAKELGIDKAVDFPGFHTNPFGMISRANAFVLSSRWEGFGNVIVESLACGTPVIATDCPSGPAEILGNGKFGKLVPICDSTALAKAMLSEISTPMPKGNLQERAKDFSIERIIPKYLEAFQSIKAGQQ